MTVIIRAGRGIMIAETVLKGATSWVGKPLSAVVAVTQAATCRAFEREERRGPPAPFGIARQSLWRGDCWVNGRAGA